MYRFIMTMDEVEREVVRLVAEVVALEVDDVMAQRDLPYRQAGLDSLDIVEIILVVEEDFDVLIEDAALDILDDDALTVSALIALVTDELRKAGRILESAA